MATFGPIRRLGRGGESLILRHVEIEEAAAVLEFFLAASASTNQILTQPDEAPQTAEDEAKFIADMLNHPGRLFLLAEHAPPAGKREIVGILGIRQHDRRRAAHTATLVISVAERWRGRGVGTALMEACVAWATDHPTIEKVCLEVFHTNSTGRALYVKVGFHEEGSRCGQAQIEPGQYVDEIFMSRWVKPRGGGLTPTPG